MAERKVFWYPVAPREGWQEVEMPEGARPVHYDQGDGGRMWAVVDPGAPMVPQRVAVSGTGWAVPDGAVHVHTDVGPTGWVWHLFRAPDSPHG